MLRFFTAVVIIFSIGSTCLASDVPTTNWGTVLKVPFDQVEVVDTALIEWGNWIKDTHPMGDEDMGLDSLTITKSSQTTGHVYYVIVERYDTPAGLKNHRSLFRRDSSGDYIGLFAKLGFMGAYRIPGAEQKKTLFSIIP